MCLTDDDYALHMPVVADTYTTIRAYIHREAFLLFSFFKEFFWEIAKGDRSKEPACDEEPAKERQRGDLTKPEPHA